MNASTTSFTVGINECIVCDDSDAMLVTYGLGSCIAVVAWDPLCRAGGMIHYSLPQSSINPEKATSNPTMFGDTGIPILFRSLYDLGAVKRHLVVKVVGGARLHGTSEGGVMDVGRRNYLLVRKLLSKNGISIAAEDVGGSKSRTVRFWIRNGTVTVSSGGIEETLLASNAKKYGPFA